MEVKEFIASLNKANFSLAVDNGKLTLKGDKNKLSREEIESIKSNKEVIDYIRVNKNQLIEYITVFPDLSTVKKSNNISSIYRLSGLQQGMLFHHLYEEGTEAHKVHFNCDFIGLNEEVFKESWQYLLKRHSILRTGFYYDAFSVPVQCVYKDVYLPIEVHDFRGLNETGQQEKLKAYEIADHAKSFNFKAAPLMRLGLLRLTEDRYRMVWTFHHILFDGWSLPILMEKFLKTYELLLLGKEAGLEEEDRYEDYIRYLERIDKHKEEAYWRNYLKDIQQPTLLPFIGTTKERNKGTGPYKSQSLQLDGAATLRIQNYAQRFHLTVNTIMQGVWAYLLYQYTGNKNVAYGVIVSGRPDNFPGVERRVGLYINTLPLRAIINTDQQITEWLLQLQLEQAASRQYQHSALHETQQWTGVKGDLFDSLLVFENYPVSEVISSQQWSLKVENVHSQDPANYPFTIVINNGEQINIDFNYNAGLLDEVYVEEIQRHFEHVLLQIEKYPAAGIKDISLLQPFEMHQLLVTFNDTLTAFPNNSTIVDLFEEQVAKTPDHIAVVFGKEELSYNEINKRSNQLAHYLRNKGVVEEMLIPLCMERSAEMIIGILGILKAGGAYVPIDIAYPVERISYMLKDTGAVIVVSNKETALKLPVMAGINVIKTDEDYLLIAQQPSNNLDIIIAPNNLAYVIYTSGSTGTPKGVMAEHINVVSLIKGADYVNLTGSDILLPTGSISFDATTFEYWSMLLSGGQLVLCAEDTLRNSKLLKEEIAARKVNKMWFTSSWFNYLIETDITIFEGLQTILAGGEKLSEKHIEKFRQTYPAIEIINGYGPTENTTFSLTYHITDTVITRTIPVGRPISNRSVFIINNHTQLVPVGIAGEICVGGAGLARGYLNRADLTGEKFISNPFSKEEGSRLYKTGDIGRWLPDGNIEYLGRIDDQVKIRGYRIELGEIESVLEQNAAVRHAAVLAREDVNGNKQLVGYVVPKEVFNREAIVSYLKDRLPGYMVPGLWMELENLPLTSNGKIDRMALPDPDVSAASGHVYVPPRNETEQKLAIIWQEVLGIEQVGIYANFFDVGGHSLLAMRAISAIRKSLEIELGIKELFVHPTIAELAAYLKTQAKTALLPLMEALPRPAHIPLSFSQERLWFIDRLEGSISYHLPAVLRLKGKLNVAALAYALQKVVSRHEVLRTVISEQDGQTYQHVLNEDGWKLAVEDDSVIQRNPIGLQQYIEQLIRAPFDLSKDYMVRGNLIIFSEQEHLLVLTTHHISSDGWSVSILVKEVMTLYESYVEKREPQLKDIQIQYADYAIWQRKYLQGDVLEEKLGYWKEKLEGVAPLELPTDYLRPAIQSTNGSVTVFHVDNNLTGQLQQLSNQHGATLFMTLLSVFKVLLYRYSGQEDICVGTPIANRTQSEIEGLIGFFINTLALRSEVRANAKFTALLEQVKTTTLEAYQHQDVPFEKVVDAVVKSRDISRSPLFQVMFVYQNTPEVPEIRLRDIQLSAEGFVSHTSKFDVTFTISETADGLQGLVQYCSDLFSAETIDGLITHFKELLHSIVKVPDEKIGVLPMLSKAEQNRLLVDFNDTLVAYPAAQTIIELFEKQVQCNPEAEALVFGSEKLSYRELNERCNQLAHYLRSCGVKEEVLVPICIEKSPQMIIGILGILKAGGAYVPVDPEYPLERIGFMLKDTQASIVIAGEKQLDKLNTISGKDKIVILDKQWHIGSSYPVTDLQVNIQGQQLAYVLYTSGSTGQPKGVAVQHNALANHLRWFNHQYHLTNEDSSLLISSFSFDGSMTATWPVLLSGGTLHLPEGDRFDPTAVLHYISENSITYLKTLPGIFKALIEQPLFKDAQLCKTLRLIIVGGERMSAPDFKIYMNAYPEILFSNHYGPTECTISSSFYLIDKSNLDLINHKSIIGKPVANTQIFIVSEEGQLNPAGVPGEICIAGIGVARGYWDRPALTAEKFVINPFSNIPGARMYKTGDMGKVSADGILEYLGRKDDQLKVRGYRIEPGEIEHLLTADESVNQVAVLAKQDADGSSNLVAYVVPEKSFNKEATISYLQNLLPDYMVPAIWIELESLPLSANGKVNRKVLADLHTEITLQQYVGPRNEQEQAITNIWQQILKLKQVGIHDNFFALGGHSLLAIRVISSVRRQLEVELVIKDLFLFPTVAKLARHIRSRQGGLLLPGLIQNHRPALIPLSYSQERLWFIDQLEGSVAYHLPVVLKLSGRLNIEALRFTLQSVIQRHEVLRTVIRENEGKGFQYVLEPDSTELSVIDGTQYSNSDNELKQFIQPLIVAPFDLSKDLLLRSTLIKLNDEEHVLVIITHHIASDGWSTSILIKEVSELYASFIRQRSPVLKPLPVQYADYALWQRQYLSGDVLEKEIWYWKEKLAGLSPLRIATDFIRPAEQSNRGSIIHFNIEKALSDRLLVLSQQEETTLFMVLLAACNILLYRYSGQQDICVGTPVTNRTQSELEELIGFFVNTLALRTTVSGEETFSELLQQIKINTLDAYMHQDAPFEKVVDAVAKDRSITRSPIFQVMFVFHQENSDADLQLDELNIAGLGYEHTTAKFDITIHISRSADGMRGVFEYGSDLFLPETISRMILHFKEILAAVVNKPEQIVGSIPMLSAAEEHQISYQFNDAETDYPKDKTVIDLFEEQVVKYAGNIALVYEEKQLTYQQLNERSNQLARYLVSKGVTGEVLVPVCLSRSFEMIIAALAVLKAGGAYVPVDPAYPSERICYILEDTNAKIVITDSQWSIKLKHVDGLEIIETDTHSGLINSQSIANPELSVSPHQLAYIIYTSGSTGKPKGVMIQHNNVVRLFKTDKLVFDFNEKDVWTLFHSFSFDFSVWEMYGALLYGARLVIVPLEVTKDVEQFEALLIKEKVTVLNQTPSAFYVLQSLVAATKLPLALRYIIFGGEALNPSKLRPFNQQYPDCKLVNMYGITETTVHVTYQQIEAAGILNSRSIIGKPIPTLTTYIVDQHENLVPVGVMGELWIGGAGVARGYLNRPELTQQRFVVNHFGKDSNEKIYKSGDLGKWLPDGTIEYLGRMDEQVKIRGYRIELGEIEQVLLQSGLVKQGTIVAKDDQQDNKTLVGYIVGNERFEKQALQTYLQSRLPEYMVPGIWATLDSLPLNSNGKIDKKALPEADLADRLRNEYVGPRNELETVLTEIWMEKLGVGQVGIYDNFFELGGHSLMAMQVKSAIRNQLQTEVAIKELFVYPTIASLGEVLHGRKNQLLLPSIEAVQQRPAFIPLSFSQDRLWFIDKLQGSTQYHISAVLRLKGRLSKPALKHALQSISNRHEILRTVIRENNGVGYQLILPEDSWNWREIDGAVYATDEALLSAFIEELTDAPFNLSEDQMLRAEIIRLDEEEYILVVTMHHIVSDGWSVAIIIKEVMEFYNAYVENRPAQLRDLTIQFADYAIWQKNYLQGEVLHKKLFYWKSKLEGLATLRLPYEYNVTGNATAKGAIAKFDIDADVTEKLHLISRQQGATLFMTLLSAFKVLMYKYTGQGDICVGTSVAGRQLQETEDLIGFFINALAIRSEVKPNESFAELLKQVSITMLEAYEYQDVPFEKVVDTVLKERDTSTSPLFQVVFAMQNTIETPVLNFGGIRLSSEGYHQETSKFNLVCNVTETANGLLGSVQYATDKFSRETVEQMINHFKELLTAINAEADQKIGDLIKVKSEETQQVIKTNETRTDHLWE